MWIVPVLYVFVEFEFRVMSVAAAVVTMEGAEELLIAEVAVVLIWT